MTIEYTQWSDLQPGREPYTRLSPRLNDLLDLLLNTWGGVSLTARYGVDVRPIRNGTSWSPHAFGAALDWRYANVGGGFREISRETLADVILPWLIANADELGVQQIHDYLGSRIWRTGRGWKANTTAAHMGEAWAQYLHIEVNAPSWATPIMHPIAVPDGTTVNPTNPPFDPEDTGTVTVLNIDHQTLKRGAKGRAVSRFQGILNANWGAQLACDGQFGPLTESAVRNMQTIAHITSDGILGPQTATVMLSQ